MTTQNGCSFFILLNKSLTVSTPFGVELDDDEVVFGHRVGEVGMVQSQHVFFLLRLRLRLGGGDGEERRQNYENANQSSPLRHGQTPEALCPKQGTEK
nr:hypothetical protein Iba_chr05aCG17800 [Ipomoea batatas]